MLKPCAEKLLTSFPQSYRELAEAAIAKGKAFCPSCAFAGHMNCGNFDECEAYIEPNGTAAKGRECN